MGVVRDNAAVIGNWFRVVVPPVDGSKPIDLEKGIATIFYAGYGFDLWCKIRQSSIGSELCLNFFGKGHRGSPRLFGIQYRLKSLRGLCTTLGGLRDLCEQPHS